MAEAYKGEDRFTLIAFKDKVFSAIYKGATLVYGAIRDALARVTGKTLTLVDCTREESLEGFRCYGRSGRWNQLAKLSPPSNRAGLTFTKDEVNNATVINGTSTSSASATGWWALAYNASGVTSGYALPSSINGHKCLMLAITVGGSYSKGTVTMGIVRKDLATVRFNLGSTVGSYGGVIAEASLPSSGTYNVSEFSQTTGTVFNDFKFSLYFIDLTEIFGAGKEPTSISDPRIAELKAYAEAHPQYDAGSLISIESPEVRLSDGTRVQSSTFPYTLRGIPVSSGGNYTDENGQQWIADYVDVDEGCIVRMTRRVELKSDMKIVSYTGSTTLRGVRFTPALIDTEYRASGICNNENNVGNYVDAKLGHYMWVGAGNTTVYWVGILGYLGIYSPDKTEDEMLAEFKTWLDAHPTEVFYVTSQPYTEPLTPSEIASFKAMKTYKPTTIVSNSEDAHMEASYHTKIDSLEASLTAEYNNLLEEITK